MTEMSKLVKFLPKRDCLLEKLKQEFAPETHGHVAVERCALMRLVEGLNELLKIFISLMLFLRIYIYIILAKDLS